MATFDPAAVLRPEPVREVRKFVSRGHQVLTDGASAVLWPEDGATGEQSEYVDAACWPKHPRTALQIDLAALRRWLVTAVPDDHPPASSPPVPCPECEGTGNVTEGCWHCGQDWTHTCRRCKGSKSVAADAIDGEDADEGSTRYAPVKVRGAWWDGRRLRKALAALPGDTASWSRAGRNEEAPLVLVGGGWRFVLMPLRGTWQGPECREV